MARGVDPDDANVAEENTLLVFLVLARAAFLPPVGHVGELRCGALLCRGTHNRKGRGLMLVDQHQSCGEEPKVSEVHPACFLSVQVRNLPKAPQSSRKIPHSSSFSSSHKKKSREQPKDIYNTTHTRNREKGFLLKQMKKSS